MRFSLQSTLSAFNFGLFRLSRKNPKERSEFSGLNDLLQYVIDKDEEEKRAKAKNKSD